MTVYCLHPSLNLKKKDYQYCSVQMIVPDETPGIRLKQEMWDKFRGKSLKEIWPAKVKYQYLSKRTARGDFPYDFQSSSYLILSLRAADALRDLLEPEGEFYPIECDENPQLTAWWPTKLCDALDTIQSDIKWFDEEEKKRPAYVKRFWFLEKMIGDTPIFQIPEDFNFFVTDRFLRRVRERNLKGFGFRKLWTPEEGCIHSKDAFGPWPEDEDINF